LKQGLSYETQPASEGELDSACARVFISILKEHRPQFALYHIIDVDHTQHSAGPNSPAAYEAVKNADARVGEIWNELKKDFPGKATLVVVSDHGFSPIQKIVLPNVILRKAGLIEEKSKRNSIQVVPQAGSAMIYILDSAHRKTLVKKITNAFHDVKEIDGIVGPDHLKDLGMATPNDDPHAPDMMIFAKEGFVFGDTAAGEIPFQIKPERAGSHGHSADLPDLHATFVAWGAGIKPGSKVGEIDNTRVAPTVAKLLKIEMPSSVKSKPISEILAQ
jgi:predicted AlkP superfamily pyrophosphatase or phosphodiesterase